jgi:hypothetical protein
MKDPSRLLSHTGSVEAQLLDAVRDVDPPLAARDEVWRRMASSSATAADARSKKLSPFAAWAARLSAKRRERRVAAGAGAATLASAAPLAARTVAGAGTKAIAQLGWLSVVKWIAVVGTVAPAAGMGVHWVVASRNGSASREVVSTPRPVAGAPVVAPSMNETSARVALPPPESVPTSIATAGALPRHGSGLAASNLDAESALLRRAREKLESGDPKAALDDVALLAARFPRGELAQEREVVAIQALLAQAQRAAAATRAADFFRLHPNSPYADSLRQALKP